MTKRPEEAPLQYRLSILILIGSLASGIAFGAEPTPEGRAVDAVLTDFHAAAASADGETYFSLLADDAIYIGTDASERWTVDEFRAFAEPYFSKGRGWTYTVTERHIAIAPGGSVAWFDEMLWNKTYGVCRGTGVLAKQDGIWRIAQYHLTFPIPNDLAREVTTRIMEHETQSNLIN
jgi:ketosteroid isomerase-like protein